MPRLIEDPLLSGTRAVILVLQFVVSAAAAGLLIGIPLALVFRDRILEEIGPRAVEAPAVIWAVVGIMFFAAGVMALGFWFLLEMRRIIETVREGDPFVPRNADRLRRMGWLALANYAAAFFMAPFGLWLATVGTWDDASQSQAGFPLGGLVLAAVLFILARVFKKGTEMREDLEGTV